MVAPVNAPGDAGEGLLRVLIEALQALDAGGRNELACKLAARGCMSVRHSDPFAYRRLDALLHRLSLKPGSRGTPGANL
ncbi:MAG TPA: hypothetical protein VIL84_09075 [Devosiaceae bacterium]